MAEDICYIYNERDLDPEYLKNSYSSKTKWQTASEKYRQIFRHRLHKEEIQMGNTFRTDAQFSENQSGESPRIYLCTPSRLAKFKSLDKNKCFWGCEIRILIYCWCNLIQLLQKIICFPFFQKIILNKIKDIYNLYTIYFVYRYILREVCVKEHQSIISTDAVTCKGPMLVVIEMFTQTRMDRFCYIQRVESYYKW